MGKLPSVSRRSIHEKNEENKKNKIVSSIFSLKNLIFLVLVWFSVLVIYRLVYKDDNSIPFLKKNTLKKQEKEEKELKLPAGLFIVNVTPGEYYQDPDSRIVSFNYFSSIYNGNNGVDIQETVAVTNDYVCVSFVELTNNNDDNTKIVVQILSECASKIKGNELIGSYYSEEVNKEVSIRISGEEFIYTGDGLKREFDLWPKEKVRFKYIVGNSFGDYSFESYEEHKELTFAESWDKLKELFQKIEEVE